MDIFISGDLTTFAPALANALLADGHTVVASQASAVLGTTNSRNLILYRTAFTDSLFPEVFCSHSFDALIHISDQTMTKPKDSSPRYSTNTAELETVLDLSFRTTVAKIILLSSIDVYGDIGIIRENDLPMPSSAAGQILLNAENICRYYAGSNMKLTIIHLPDVYGRSEEYSALSYLIRESKKESTVEVPFGRFDHCNFLHVEDLSELVCFIINDAQPANPQVFNPGTEDINFDFLSQQLNLHTTKNEYTFSKVDENPVTTRKITASQASSIYGWKPRHNVIVDIPDLAQQFDNQPEKKRYFQLLLDIFSKKMRPFLVWLEVVLGAFFMHMLTIWTNTIIAFRVVDFRLLFVVIIGSIHGLLFGVIAAILAAVSAFISWGTVELDFALLVNNVENWIPFTAYFLAGAVTGYVHDKQENDLRFAKQQTELIHEKYTSLYLLYDENSTIKDRLRE